MVHLKGTRVRNCVEKDVVITVDKCRKERRNRNSAPTNDAIHFLLYLVWRYKASAILPFRGPLTRIHALKVSTLRDVPFHLPLPRAISSCVSYTIPLCATVSRSTFARVCGKTADIKRAYRTWNPRGFPRDEKLMARQVPERYYYFAWWLVTPSLWAFATYLSSATCRGGGNHRFELETNITHILRYRESGEKIEIRK